MRCPFIGTEQEQKYCKRHLLNIRGFKSHLTRQHGGWSDDQVAAALASEPQPSQPTPEEKELFASDGETAYETPQTISVPQGSDAPKRERSASAKSRKAGKELSDALDGIKNDFCSMIPGITQGILATKLGIVGSLSEKATESVSKLWNAYINMLGFEIETDTEPTKVKVKGRVVKLLMPFAIVFYTLAVMTGVHKVEVDGAKPKPKPPEVVPIFTPEQPPINEEVHAE